MARAPRLSPIDPRGELGSPSFLALLATQFLGAFNDNMFRWLVVPLAQPVVGAAEALALGLVCFTIPYLLLATAAGYFADRFSKRTVIVGCKLAEIVIMALGVAAIVHGNVWLLFVVVALMGSQSALFSPAKFGSIPEMLRPERISAGNGWMGLVTVAASALGVIAGYALFASVDQFVISSKAGFARSPTFGEAWPIAAGLVGVAAAGWLASLFIARLTAADPSRRLAINPVSDTYRNMRLLVRQKALLRTALGIAFFWLLASLAQMNIDPFGDDVLGLEKTEIGTLLAILVAGLGIGSVLAGLASGQTVELGLVPLGAAGIALSSLGLYIAGSSVDPAAAASAQQAWYWSAASLFALGLFAGLFNIPLEAYLQHRSDARRRGTILAASNFLSFSFILGAAGLFFLMKDKLGMSASGVFLAAGLGTVPVVIYAFTLLPNATIRFVVWLAAHTIYRVRVHGRENLPERGGALLVANHVSWLDGILLLITSSRPIRMVAHAAYVEDRRWWWLCRMFGVIPIKAVGGPKALLRSLQVAREAVQAGELVCIFAEGRITRTGHLQPFQPGLLRIVKGTDAPVVPVYLDELWGSIFSYHGGRFFWKKPRRWPYPVSIHFGPALPRPVDAEEVRRAVQDLGVKAVERRKHRSLIPARLFLRRARRALFRSKVADSTGTELTGGRLLAGSLIFKKLLERHVLDADEKMVGILLPPSVGGVLTNAALTLSGRVAVNLNYTLSQHDMDYCVREAGIRHVVTSRKFLEKRPMEFDAETVFVEDLREKVTAGMKLAALAQAYLLPAAVLERVLGLHRVDPDDLLTVVFTSGSTGEPKGVMLSHHNVGSNISAVDDLFHITKEDVLLGVLPFFHSFGYTATLWLTLSLDPKCVYHYNPLDARILGKLAKDHGVTILLATPTFLRTYLKRCSPEEFHKLDLVIVGAEKMPLDIANAFEEKFGVEPTEGYGTTELSPVAAFNVPDHRAGPEGKGGTKFGTVGRIMPGAAAKIVDPDTGRELGPDQEGLLFISGPNVMKGYLNQPEKTAAVLRDGWYDTGDMAAIDEEGFIRITGRQSRFSKIGGEMVPHVKIEELINRLVDRPDDGEPQVRVAVTAVPDEKKGERLIVLHKPLDKSPDEIVRDLEQSNLPNLWIPGRDCFIEVDEIPILGTGKLDLRGVRELALERACGEPSAKA
ncbi:MAG: acyl-[ACP]--phospholipid O-acyltransferase [Planctomycetales bacterium]